MNYQTVLSCLTGLSSFLAEYKNRHSLTYHHLYKFHKKGTSFFCIDWSSSSFINMKKHAPCVQFYTNQLVDRENILGKSKNINHLFRSYRECNVVFSMKYVL